MMTQHGRRLYRVIACLLVLCTLPLTAVGETALARFSAGQAIAWPVTYDDRYFATTGENYQQSLARASLGMALSAFRTPDVPLANKGDAIQTYLAELGFRDITRMQYDITPAIDTIATAIAYKQTHMDGETQTVLAVAVSGGGYQNEWESNFLVGDGIDHEGFDRAAQQVYARITDYLAQHPAIGTLKVWLCGYSRAAATANRTAALVLDNGLVAPANLYAYTFATPNVTKQADAADYPSIFNIVGAFDPVPSIPLEDWGYGHFGTTFYLPSPETNSDYATRSTPVKTLYTHMTGIDYWANPSGNYVLQKLIAVLNKLVPDDQVYTEHFQAVLIEAWENKSSPLKLLFGLSSALSNDPVLFSRISEQMDDLSALLSNAFYGALLQTVQEGQGGWNDAAGLTENVMHEHYPTGYLAWVNAYIDPEAMVTHNRHYRRISLDDDATLTIADADGHTVMAYPADEATAQAAGEPAFPLVQAGDEMVLTLPADEDYQISVSMDDSLPTMFTLREGSIGHTQMDVFIADSTPMQADAWYTCALPATLMGANGHYTLQWSGGEIACNYAPDGTPLDERELNSTAKTEFSKSLSTYAAMLVTLLAQLFFCIVLIGRAMRRHRHNVRVRKQRKVATLTTKDAIVPDAPAHTDADGDASVAAAPRETRPADSVPTTPQSETQPQAIPKRKWQPLRIAIKVLAGILLVLCLLILIATGLLGTVLLADRGMQSWAMVVWYLVLTLLPLFCLILLSVIPALFGTIYLLLWRKRDEHHLRTGRLFVLCALPSAILLPILSGVDQLGYVAIALLGTLALLTLCVPIARKRQTKRAAANHSNQMIQF